MSVTYGFYNSSNGDRKYSARQISSIFDGIINDGIYQNYGSYFGVSDARVVDGTNGMYVYVQTGRAWLNHTWTLNDSILKVNIDAADLINPRIDTVVIEVNESTRINSIKVVKGTATTSPVAPTLTNTSTVHQHPLADVRVNAGATYIALSNITNRIGRDDGTPWVTGLFETMSAESIIAEWQSQWDTWLDDFKDAANDAVDTFLDSYTEDADAKLIQLLGEALSNNRAIRIFGISETAALFPKSEGTSKTYSQRSPIIYGTYHDFTTDFYPNIAVQLGDYLIDANGTVAKITYKAVDSNSKIYGFTVESTGMVISPQSDTRVLFYSTPDASDVLPGVDESKCLGSGAMDHVCPSTRVVEGDILIGDDGRVARVLSDPYEWDEQLQDYITMVRGIAEMSFSGSSSETTYTSLELESKTSLRVKLHNAPSYNGLYIRVQKLVGRTHGLHQWADTPIGFAVLKADASSKYAAVPIPSWMPNAGVLQKQWAVTSDILSNGLTINLSTWLLDAMKPIFITPTAGNLNPDQSDSLAGFADGSYVALIGEYLIGPKTGRIANSRKYSLDVRYRFVLSDGEGNIIGTTGDALSIPYRTFWKAGGGTKRKVVAGENTVPYKLNGSFRIVAT